MHPVNKKKNIFLEAAGVKSKQTLAVVSLNEPPNGLPTPRTSASLKLDALSLKARHSRVLSPGGHRGLISCRVCHVDDGTTHWQKDPPCALPVSLHIWVPKATAPAPHPRREHSGKDTAIILRTAKWKVEGFILTRQRVGNDNMGIRGQELYIVQLIGLLLPPLYCLS